MRYYKLHIIFILFIGLSPINGYGQNKIDDIKRKQKLLENDILETNSLLKNTQRKKIKTINQLYILKKQIKNREELIREITEEVKLFNVNINKNLQEIDSIKERYDQIEKEYLQVISNYNKIYREKGSILAYIFSSEDVNQAYKRLKYYQQYLEYSKKIFKELVRTEKSLKKENDKLIVNKKKQEETKERYRKEMSLYTEEKKSKNKLALSLRMKEKQLKKELVIKESIKEKLAVEMRRIIEEENSENKGIVLTREEKTINGEFDKNKGKLPWPSEKGIIVETFGEHKHPVLKNVIVKNEGIDILTEKGTFARVIYKGIVRKIVAIPGANETVIIKHGGFYSVYQNLYNVKVKVGQRVEEKENIGVIFTNSENNETVLHFEIWEGTKNINPEDWLVK